MVHNMTSSGPLLTPLSGLPLLRQGAHVTPVLKQGGAGRSCAEHPVELTDYGP